VIFAGEEWQRHSVICQEDQLGQLSVVFLLQKQFVVIENCVTSVEYISTNILTYVRLAQDLSPEKLKTMK